jgi:Cft2 family RNA processing exonuclease
MPQPPTPNQSNTSQLSYYTDSLYPTLRPLYTRSAAATALSLITPIAPSAAIELPALTIYSKPSGATIGSVYWRVVTGPRIMTNSTTTGSAYTRVCETIYPSKSVDSISTDSKNQKKLVQPSLSSSLSRSVVILPAMSALGRHPAPMQIFRYVQTFFRIFIFF